MYMAGLSNTSSGENQNYCCQSAAAGCAVIACTSCTLQPGVGPYSDGPPWTCVNTITTVMEHIVMYCDSSGSSASHVITRPHF